MADDVIVAARVVVRYRGKTALDGLDLRVPRGAVYAFLGDNGAGKTTTMKVLTGLAPADAGRAEILGLDCYARALELRHRVGYMPERPRFYDWMSVADIGWFTAAFHRPGFLARYREWTDRLGLDPTKKLKSLSKGGYARVGLALALAPDPEVLLLDEPTSGLDLITRREFLASLVEFAAEGRTILISSHSLAELERAASHAAFVQGGKVILTSTLDDLRKRFTRLSMRCDGLPPDGRGLGTVLETQKTGRFIQYLLRDPNDLALQGLRDTPGVSDVEEQAVGLEDIYAALMQHGPHAPAERNGTPDR